MIIENPIRANKEVTLRSIYPWDVGPAYLSWMQDADVNRYTEQRFNEHSIDSLMDYVRAMNESNEDLLLGIFTGDLHVGNVKLGAINEFHKTAEIGFMLGAKDHWGRGISTLSVAATVKFGFDLLGLMKIYAGYYEQNIGSAKVLAKCGFEIEGVRKQQAQIGDQRTDVVLVGLMSSKSTL